MIRLQCARDDIATVLAAKISALPVVVPTVALAEAPCSRPTWQFSGDRDVLFIRMLTALTCPRESYAAALSEVEGMFTDQSGFNL